MIKQYEYGTAEYYSEMFSDIIAEIDGKGAPKSMENVLNGFLMAIDSWLEYHTDQANVYTDLRSRIHHSLGVL